MADDYVASAVRHWIDGGILQECGRTENALCHYGFSAECAIKALYNWVSGEDINNNLRHLKHKISDIVENFDTLCAFYPQFMLSLPDVIPPKLFEGHPARRYERNFPCMEAELQACAEYVDELNRSVLSGVLDYDWEGIS